MGDTASIVLAALVGLVVTQAAFGNGRLKDNLTVIKAYRVKHFAESLVILVIVATVAWLLTTQVPYFDKNPILWMISGLFGEGNGDGTSNAVFVGIQWKLYAIIFLPILALAIPRLAIQEEIDFRHGTRSWKDGAVRSLIFGLVHLIMLIPIGVALALSIGGLWFTHHYFKGGLPRSSVYHAAYNTLVISVVLVAVILA